MRFVSKNSEHLEQLLESAATQHVIRKTHFFVSVAP